MNKVMLLGRLTHDPEVRYAQNQNGSIAVANYSLAVDRRFKKDGEPTADFLRCVAFGKGAEFTEKYFRKGMRVAITGRLQTGSYTDKDGKKIYTTEIIVEEQDFADGKSSGDGAAASAATGAPAAPQAASAPQDNGPSGSGFMNIPDGIDEDLPFA